MSRRNLERIRTHGRINAANVRALAVAWRCAGR